ncbi:Cylicin-2, partial [Ophiophagus hannah]
MRKEKGKGKEGRKEKRNKIKGGKEGKEEHEKGKGKEGRKGKRKGKGRKEGKKENEKGKEKERRKERRKEKRNKRNMRKGKGKKEGKKEGKEEQGKGKEGRNMSKGKGRKEGRKKGRQALTEQQEERGFPPLQRQSGVSLGVSPLPILAPAIQGKPPGRSRRRETKFARALQEPRTAPYLAEAASAPGRPNLRRGCAANPTGRRPPTPPSASCLRVLLSQAAREEQLPPSPPKDLSSPWRWTSGEGGENDVSQPSQKTQSLRKPVAFPLPSAAEISACKV